MKIKEKKRLKKLRRINWYKTIYLLETKFRYKDVHYNIKLYSLIVHKEFYSFITYPFFAKSNFLRIGQKQIFYHPFSSKNDFFDFFFLWILINITFLSFLELIVLKIGQHSFSHKIKNIQFIHRGPGTRLGSLSTEKIILVPSVMKIIILILVENFKYLRLLFNNYV